MAIYDKTGMSDVGLLGSTTIGKVLETKLQTPAIAAADVVLVIPIPANTFVQQVRVRIITAAGGVGTIGVGDSALATQYFGLLDANAVSNGVSAAAAGKYYAAADNIRITFAAAAPALKIEVDALIITY